LFFPRHRTQLLAEGSGNTAFGRGRGDFGPHLAGRPLRVPKSKHWLCLL
jgi:hypothetical protein